MASGLETVTESATSPNITNDQMEKLHMRKLAIIGAVIGAVVALSAIASTMASAAPEFLQTGVKFTSFSGKGTLAVLNGNTIVCNKDTNSGEIVTRTTLIATIDFSECTIFGFINAHSLGDPSNTILVTTTGTLCQINAAEHRVGVRLTPTGLLHIEATGALAVVEGTVIGELTPVNRKSKEGHLILEQSSAGVQKIKKCEGGAEEHLTTKENEGSGKESSEVTTDTIGFASEVELMG